MSFNRSFTFLALMALVVTALTLSVARPAAGAPTASNVYSLTDLSQVERSRSALQRTDSGISATFHSTGLEPGHAVTLWWVVFNYPEHCENGIPNISRCGEGDFFNTPEAQPSMLYAAGHVIGKSGHGNFAAHLSVGDTRHVYAGPGLLNPHGAEVLLITRTHGPAIPGMVDEQIHSYDGGCNPGPNHCQDVQLSAHTP